MRDTPYSLADKIERYDQLARAYMSATQQGDQNDSNKDEMESLEDTDTEKRFKKVNCGIAKKFPNRIFGNFTSNAMHIENKHTSVDQIEKYKKAYEMEKLRYAEERSKYFY